MIDYFSCMNCSRSYTSGQSQAAKTPVQVGKAVTSWHATCPTCECRQSFAAVQMFAPVMCGDCGLSYGVP